MEKTAQAGVYRELILLMMRAKRQMCVACEPLDMTPVQGMLLVSLKPGLARSMNELSDIMGCDASNITGLIDRLESSGCIERTADDQDKRVKKICLTEKGIKCRKVLLASLGEAESLDASKLSEEEVKALHSITAKLGD